ncbi:Alkanesulfonate monooxygenase [Acinetobacter oleivorans]|uniref:LLM class flavin-dependent oxidoreductase n=1 Tax=Acinetobacter oleivorans TaxID=1148157 RepID=UPI0021EFF895|nr:Alkanesulfonate monooxygenase [Acinetobacter oleivorans]CAI3138505.1 Alkanesulfonate monooxygenase [Acinetobacter oleivorans]CAI3139010.1 Alkanesulfonate monooxygenase [Acinetobacter oleivorans]CAI3139027.1 Alkanesulfonate monooxygenase [Acinetobacter oleivorans]CAI3139066.1 Alkanesulfonate monooxygenase [Acinetobacter oleivorans]
MAIQILGMIWHREASEIIPATKTFDKNYIVKIAQAHEQAGFDRILCGYWSDQADGFLVTAYAAAHTSKIKFLLAHRPGFVSPTLAARKLATLDQLTDGRLALHVISGGSDIDQKKDGDFLNKQERYARSAEFIEVVQKTWYSQEPFSYEGDYYHVVDAYSEIKPLQTHLPIYFGGSSIEALQVAAKQVDIFALWGEPLAGAQEQVETLNQLAAQHERQLDYNISFRPIIADSESRAWEKAQEIYQLSKKQLENFGLQAARKKPQSTGGQRLLAAAGQGERLDTNLWTGITSLVQGSYNSTALVGTPEQVAESILQYYKLGIRSVLIRGFDPVQDAIDYGRELLPQIREKTEKYDQQQQLISA